MSGILRINKPRVATATTLLVAGLLVAGLLDARAKRADAGDWPQILGPHRNGVAEGETLTAKWPADGPPRLWQAALGSGYAGPAVKGDRVLAFHRVDDVERVEAFDVASGRSLWRADFEANYRGGINPDTGPRCVPVIHHDRVIAFGAAGDLHCVALADGKKLWSRSTFDDFDGDEGYFGAGSTPIAIGDAVLVNVGGREGAGLVAFSLKDGATLWSKTDERASYSSPTYAEIDGKPHAIFVTRTSAISVDPATGDVRFQFPFGKRGPTVNAATPLVFDKNLLFVSASYGVGAKLARIGDRGVETVWANDEVMSSQYTTCVFRNDYLYGVDGREDIGVGVLRCLDAKTGQVQWSVDDFGVAHAILAGDKLLLAKNDGRLVLAEASPKGFHELAGADLFDDQRGAVVRAIPALSNGRLFVRGNNGGESILRCFGVGEK
ncbi:MAG: PQQ-binding-like beta-propeller repeat protein [Pirellulaceae bacterium]